MVSPGFGLFIAMTVLLSSSTIHARESKFRKLNAIDRCRRSDPEWRNHREKLATCSVGFAGKMTNNIGEGTIHYRVTDPSDDPLNPRPGSLRFGATMIKEKVWITFDRDMNIKLRRPLLVSSFTAIDGRGAAVRIGGGGCLSLRNVTDVIIHGLRIHDCKGYGGNMVIGPNGVIEKLSIADGDAIGVMSSRKIWIDHNTLSNCHDGLLDATLGSTDITISNNWFRDHKMVMLLGHDDSYEQDKNMRVTVAFNYFGPDVDQRMPRVRHGYAHVVNNLYKGWGLYAIGGSTGPTVRSEGNLFIAPETKCKEVTRKIRGETNEWNFHSVRDVFKNGAVFSQTGTIVEDPHYDKSQAFQVEDANDVSEITRTAGILRCHGRGRC